VADIFVSYTSSDRDWAFWIGQELEKLGHAPHIHEWEIDAGGDIPAWMEQRVEKADYVLCVVSDVYLTKPYSSWERRSAQWAAQDKRRNFALLVFVEDCEAPITLAHIKCCNLCGLSEADARAQLAAYLTPARRPPGPVRFPNRKSSGPVHFPGKPQSEKLRAVRKEMVAQQSGALALSNIPIAVPLHFLGRDEALQAIDAALKQGEGRVAITALHGLRGVGKTTLAAAYAERRRTDYRATWWIRAQTESTMRADLVALGVRLGWVAADEKEEPALAAARERLRDDGEGLLLIYDNAIGPASLRGYLPPGGAARVLVTSNDPNWRKVGMPIEIEVWSKDVGAKYLIARTGRERERAEAEALSVTLGGLPLAHEQAAAYCERLEVSLADYRRRFYVAPARLLDAEKDAPAEYRDGLTVAKTFALAIDEAAKLHPAAEPLIVHAALLAPEPIPLFLFSEGREEFGEPLASELAGDGLDEAVAALRTFALVDRETIPDERDATITTETIRLHRLVRTVAAARPQGDATDATRRVLIQAMAAVYPREVNDDPSVWPMARRLDALALDLVGGAAAPQTGTEAAASNLLEELALYRRAALAAYPEARALFQRALVIRENVVGPEHPATAASLNNLAGVIQSQGDLAGARPPYVRALAIREESLGPKHPSTAASLNNLAGLLEAQGDLAGARPLYERALAIFEEALGPEHPDTAGSLNNLADLLRNQGDLAGARPLYVRALAIHEKSLGPKHPSTAASLTRLARLLEAQGDLVGARPLIERALAIFEKALGANHLDTNLTRVHLASVHLAQGALAEALALSEPALAALEKVLGPDHPVTKASVSVRTTANALAALGRGDEAAALRVIYGLDAGTAE
jgi:tetratricopeptide (TPR) repeat protein